MSQGAANSFHHFGIFLQQHPSYFFKRSSVVLVVDEDREGGRRRERGRRRVLTQSELLHVTCDLFQSSLLFCSFSIHFTVKRISKECARKPGKKICRQGGMYDLTPTYTMPQKEEHPANRKKKEELYVTA